MKDFPEHLSKSRHKANLTNQQLADRANVPCSLIAGLQSGKRRVGEYQAIKIGKALGFTGKDLEGFVHMAINTCTVKVLREHQAYPSEILNYMARTLRERGILPENMTGCSLSEGGVGVNLADGSFLQIEAHLKAT